MDRSTRTALTGLAAVLSIGVAACGGDADDRMAADTAVATAPMDQPTAAAPALRVTEVWLGRAMVGDTAVAEDMDDFAPTDTIHAVVRHEGAAQNATITARWVFQDGQVVDERSETVSPSGTAAAYTHFMIAKPTAWPAGDYRLHVLVNGQEVETEEFEVQGG